MQARSQRAYLHGTKRWLFWWKSSCETENLVHQLESPENTWKYSKSSRITTQETTFFFKSHFLACQGHRPTCSKASRSAFSSRARSSNPWVGWVGVAGSKSWHDTGNPCIMRVMYDFFVLNLADYTLPACNKTNILPQIKRDQWVQQLLTNNSTISEMNVSSFSSGVRRICPLLRSRSRRSTWSNPLDPKTSNKWN